MNSIYSYIAYDLHSPETAMRQYQRIADAILKLEQFPKRCLLFESEPEYRWGLRRMFVDNFLVCYLIESGVVYVTDVFIQCI